MGCQANNGEVIKDSLPLFEKGQELGKIPDLINEASGLAASTVNEGAFWTHNDSGDESRVFLISEEAKLLATVALDGVENRDWEEITVGPGPEVDKSYLYIGEIGDNEARYQTKFIYRLEEPKVDVSIGEQVSTSSEIAKIEFAYPDGKRDAETFFIDHATRDLYVISKRENNVHVYVMKYPQLTDGVNTLAKLGSIPFYNVVAADIFDGKEIILKTYDNVYYWRTIAGESIFETLNRPAQVLPYKPEPQGETIAWKKDGAGYFTVSERNGQISPDLLYYKRN
jgi:hypothetical protein